MVSIAAFSKNVSLEDVKYNVSLNSLGVSDEGTIGDVHYTKYYSDEPRLDFYVFAKDGRAFLVTCDLLSNGVAEDIIKSLKVRKWTFRNLNRDKVLLFLMISFPFFVRP